MPSGRVSTYTPELGERILERISCGESLVTICQDKDMPGRTTVMRWVNQDPVFRDNYCAATRDRMHSYAEQIVEIADDPEIDPNVARVRIYARQWVMARLDPRKWGDKVAAEISGPGGGPIQTEAITHLQRAKAAASLFARSRALALPPPTEPTEPSE